MNGARLSVALCCVLTGCGGVQSALAPAGRQADEVATLFWAMLIAAAAIWLLVIAGAHWALRADPARYGERAAGWIIIGGGVVFPVTVLAALLTYGLSLLSQADAEPALTVRVSGEQWWWRIGYVHEAFDAPIESANEIRVPAGRPVAFELDSPDVIHSFWIPSLGGKLDMIPGRTNRLVLTPLEPGRYRGVCAEFCGTSHALMAFDVVVMPSRDFTRWLRAQAAPAHEASDEPARRGRELFHSTGCAACHTVRGHAETGQVGPDLTHVGTRASLGAGTLPNTRDNLTQWIASPQAIKPGALMPAFAMLAQEEIDALAAYLAGLE